MDKRLQRVLQATTVVIVVILALGVIAMLFDIADPMTIKDGIMKAIGAVIVIAIAAIGVTFMSGKSK